MCKVVTKSQSKKIQLKWEKPYFAKKNIRKKNDMNKKQNCLKPQNL